MDGTPAFLVASALIAVGGLLGAPLTPVAAGPDTTVTAEKKPEIDQQCRHSYKHDRQRLQRMTDAAIDYYTFHENSEQAMLDQLVSLLADPNAAEAIPSLERGAAQFRTTVQPIIAEDRHKALKETKEFEKTYKKCFSTRKGKDALAAGTGMARSSFRDLYRAHEKLLGANGAIQAAQASSAGDYMTQAQTEYITVQSTFDRGMNQLRGLQ